MKQKLPLSGPLLAILETSYTTTKEMILRFEKWAESGSRLELEELKTELEKVKGLTESRDSLIERFCYRAGEGDIEKERLIREIVEGEFEFAFYTARYILNRTNPTQWEKK